MRHVTWMVLVGVACFAAFPSQAAIYKCKGAAGKTVYQDIPCADASRTERTYQFHDDTPSGAGAVGQSKAWKQVARRFVARHPDVGYGQNVTLLNMAMREVFTPQMSSLDALEAGYAKARMLPGWSHAPRARESVSQTVASGASDDHVGGLGVSAYASGNMHAVRCTTADGRVYYAKGVCGTTTSTRVVAGRHWQRDRVQGVPGAVMVGPNQAINPGTGKLMELQGVPDTTVMHVTTRDRAQAVSADEACAQAQAAEAEHPFSKKLTRRVSELCQQGHSLYDEKPSRGSLYYDGGH